jgi:hypothetical protein
MRSGRFPADHPKNHRKQETFMPFPNPPADLSKPGADTVSLTSVDATQFDVDGTVKFNFNYDNTPIGDHLKIKVTRHCRDHNFKFIPWKDCRPEVDVITVWSKKYDYGTVPGLGVKKVLTFRAHYRTSPTKDDECLWLFLTIDVQSGTELLPGVNASADIRSWLGNAAASGGLTPIWTWTIPFKLCCHDCELTCIPDPPELD